MFSSGALGQVIFWSGAVGLAVSSTAGLFVSWFAAFGISLPPGQVLDNAYCVINLNWSAVVPFAAFAGVSSGAMLVGRMIAVRCRKTGR
jgi:uncharacterized membrane protein (DUF441 family)